MQKETSGVIDQLFKAGAHFGFSRSRRHPSVKSYIFGSKNKTEIIDLAKTAEGLDAAVATIGEIVGAGKQVLFVGTKPEARAYVREAALSVSMPSVTERWIGGLLTNWGEVKKRVARLEDLLSKREKGELAVYTKKERLLFDREIETLEKKFGGVTSLSELPKALFIVDPRYEKTAIAEAKQMRIPIIALASTDCDIRDVAFPIIGNDAASPSLAFFTGAIADAVRAGKTKAPKAAPEEEVKKA